jgi:uncharacterized repeat protein (TIGR02543 family)
VSAVTFTPSSYVSANTAAIWTIGFTTSSSGALVVGNAIDVTFPSGFNVTGATAAFGSGFHAGCTAPTVVINSHVVIIPLTGAGCALSASTSATVTITGLSPIATQYGHLGFVVTTYADSTFTTPIDGSGASPASFIDILASLTYSTQTSQNSATFGGTAPIDASSPYSTAFAPTTPTVIGNTGNLTLAGYAFAGWCTTNAAANPTLCTGTHYNPGDIFTILANTTLYSQWTLLPTYTVTYSTQTSSNSATTGSAPSDGSSPYVSGSSVTLLNNTGPLTLLGYTFAGWCTTNAAANPTLCTGTHYNAGDTFTISANTTLYSQWSVAAVALNYSTQTSSAMTNATGSAPSDPSSPYTPNSSATVANAGSLTLTGYTFAGWCTNDQAANPTLCTGGVEYASGASFTISGRTTLYSVWTANTETVTFVADGGDAVAPISGLYNTVVTLPPDTQSGYTFNGWFTSPTSGTQFTSLYTLTGTVTLYAHWTPHCGTGFALSNGLCTPIPVVNSVTASSHTPGVPIVVWIAGPNFAASTSAVNSVTYGPTSGTQSPCVNVIYVSATLLTCIVGADLAPGVPVSFIVTVNGVSSAPSAVTYTAYPTCAPGSYWSGSSTCTLAPAGSYVVTVGATSATPCPLGTYNDLPGNYTCYNASPNTYVATTGATSATPCPLGTSTRGQVGQASLTSCVPEIVITGLNSNGLCVGDGSLTLTFCPLAGIPLLTVTGYNLVSGDVITVASVPGTTVFSTPLATLSTSIGAQAGPSTVTVSVSGVLPTDPTIAATVSFRPAPTETITFVANDTSGVITIQNVPYGVATNLDPFHFARNGYTFIGWNTVADGSGTPYKDSASITANGNVTLYAQWQKIPLALTTSTSLTSSTVVTGQSVTISATVSPAPSGGTVAFSAQGQPITGCSAAAVAVVTGTATCTTTFAAGAESIIAAFSGTSGFQSSTSSPFSQTVNQSATSIALVANPSTAATGDSVTYTATVSAVAPGRGTPLGTINFFDGSVTLCSATLSSGTGSCSATMNTTGARSITAIYAGDGNFSTSTSAATTVTVASRATAPAVPSAVTATVGTSPGSATVSWTAGAANGAPVTGYTITSTDVTVGVAGPSKTSSGTSVNFTGLIAGDEYLFSVTATNSAGTSTPPAASNLIVPLAAAAAHTSQSTGTTADSHVATGTITSPGSSTTVFAAGTGVGTVKVSTYKDNPLAGLAIVNTSGTTHVDSYVDVNVAPTSNFKTLTITICNLPAGDQVDWYNPIVRALQRVTDPISINPKNKSCVDITVTKGSKLQPTLKELEGTLFALAHVTPKAPGLLFTNASGNVFASGSALKLGSVDPKALSNVNRVIGITSKPDGKGYWVPTSYGNVYAFGTAKSYGQLARSGSPIAAMSPTKDDRGYYLVARNGQVSHFGDAVDYGSLVSRSIKPKSSIVSIGLSSDGNGYWLVDGTGEVYAFGDAHLYGSLVSRSIIPKSSIVSIGLSSDGNGYWLVDGTGEVYAFGDAHLYGSLKVKPSRASVVAIAVSRTGKGYSLVRSNGVANGFGDAKSYRAPKGLKGSVVSGVLVS